MVGGADGSDASLEAWSLSNFDVFTPVARGARGTETLCYKERLVIV